MTVHALISGTLFRTLEQRIAKSGNPFVSATLKETTGDATKWISVVAFSQNACAELLRLDDGDAVSVQGLFKIGKYEKDGETKLSLSLTVNAILALRQPPKKREPKSPAVTPQNRSTSIVFDDGLPF